jgi:hypothetical protein
MCKYLIINILQSIFYFNKIYFFLKRLIQCLDCFTRNFDTLKVLS